jgi:hypothetical protein
MQQFLSNFKHFQKKFRIKNGKYFNLNLNIKEIIKEFKTTLKKKFLLNIKLKIFFENNLFNEKFSKLLKKVLKKNELIYKFRKKKITKISDKNNFNQLDTSNNLFLNNKYKFFLKKEEKMIYFSLNKLFFDYEKWKYFQYSLQNNLLLSNYCFFSEQNVKNLNYYRFFLFKYNNLSFYDKNFKINLFLKNIMKKIFFPITIKQINYKTPSGFKTSSLKFKLNNKKNFFFNIFNILYNLNKSKKKKKNTLKLMDIIKKLKYLKKMEKNFFLKKI